MARSRRSLGYGMAWLVAALFAGCALPDYQKVGDEIATDGPAAEPASAAACCSATGELGCTADASVQECVCATDSYCCEYGWDESCVAQVSEFGCGTCPEGSAGAGGEEEPGECVSASDCELGAPMCADGVCVQCTSDADCSAAFADFPYCGEDKSCGECKADVDCESVYGVDYPYCTDGTCAACRTDADCTDGACLDGYCE